MGNYKLQFFLFFSILVLTGLNSCATQDTGFNFYEGLKKNSRGEKAEAISLFEKSLETKNINICAAAAAELMELQFAGIEIPVPINRKIRQKTAEMIVCKTAGFWGIVLDILENTSEGSDKALAAILNNGNRPFDAATQFLIKELGLKHSVTFNSAENAAINGRNAVSRQSYREGLNYFRQAIEEAPWLFFRYPDLIIDLGRCFQYGSADNEGIDLFLEWGQNVELRKIIPQGLENLVQYRLVFYTARIARQRGVPHIDLFEQALLWALSLPEKIQNEQVNACIWYILNEAMNKGTDYAMQYLIKYIPQCRDDTYFYDIIDRLTCELVQGMHWEKILDLFSLFQNYSNVLTARYAWIIGRAIEEGFFQPGEIIRSIEILPKNGFLITDESLKKNIINSYITIAYNKSIEGTLKFIGAGGAAALYYRAMSAAALNQPFLFKQSKNIKAKKSNTEEMNFLTGFFEHDAAQFALKFIKMMEDDLSPDDLQILAGRLNESGQYQQSIRLVTLYAGNESRKVTVQDLELLYPRLFKDLIEKYAVEADIDPAILFGLIHTESSFEAEIKSHAGAAGLTQLMPATAEEQAQRIHKSGGPNYYINGKLDFINPAVNIHIGSSYLAYLNERMGDTLLALLAYNGGINRVRRWLGTAAPSLPVDLFLETVEFSETRNYGKSVIAAAAMYRELYK